MQTKHDSEQATNPTSFAHFLNNNKINLNVLISAFNSAQTICGPLGEKINFDTVDELKNALADIDLEKNDIYNMTAQGRLGNALDKYQIPKDDLSYSEQLIYEALLWHFEAEFVASLHDDHALMLELMIGGDNYIEMEQLQKEMQDKATQATQLFANELKNTEAKIQNTFFNRLQDFFVTPSLGRDIIIGIGIGVLAVGISAAVIAASIGSAGIVPALFGAAAAGLSTAAAGGILAAVSTAVVGLFAGVAAAVGKLVRFVSESQQNESTNKASPVPSNDANLRSSARVMLEGGLTPGDRPEPVPAKLTEKPIISEAPKQDKPKIDNATQESEVSVDLSPAF